MQNKLINLLLRIGSMPRVRGASIVAATLLPIPAMAQTVTPSVSLTANVLGNPAGGERQSATYTPARRWRRHQAE